MTHFIIVGKDVQTCVQNIIYIQQSSQFILYILILQRTDHPMSSHLSRSSACYFCQSNSDSSQLVVAHSLYGKYSFSENFYYTKDIDAIILEAVCPATARLNELNYLDQEEEYLKREYENEEYYKKITVLSEYYKFHRDLPVWGQKSIDSIMSKYYDRMKDVDYKKIKAVLKKQQNISITTQKDFSSFSDNSDITKKSKYSFVLNNLSQNQSNALWDICEKIDKKLKKVKGTLKIQGKFKEDKNFQKYLKNFPQKKKKKLTIDLNPNLLKRGRIKISQKTTENQTIEKDEKSKTKNRSTTCRSKENKHIKKSKSLNTFKIENFIDLVSTNKLKTIDQIYRNQPKEGMRIKSNIKSRCSSQNILIPEERRKDFQIKNKTQRVSRAELSHKESKKSLSKCNSIKRINSVKKIGKNKTQDYFTEKKNKIIDEILQTKLVSFKKKQPVFG